MIRKRSLSVALAVTGLILCGFGAARAALGQAEQEEREALSASADVGRVLDREGVAARRAVLADRWSPVEEGTPLEAGDWLEVGSRGANALKVRLAAGGELLLGPGALIEVVEPDRIALLRGEVRVEAGEGASVQVAGPGQATMSVDEHAVLRARDGQLERLGKDPRWLVGYEANASTEAMGSLLANVDGRNVPLTIGYHKVTVDIRDQIARTVIEESFVNHTSTVLEGVFYFPLPADASISGFGMWINGELVQGDIVEKQRAREIYETILRERRDPGLLEWTGGNIFKARVYPIGSEKRIRIAYTQVLPKKESTYTYHYALQSELLRKTPLRRLEIEVNVSSTEPLATVECPSHATRIRTGRNAAKLEFSADEFAPDRDFELRVGLQPRDERLTVVPHRRGDDGYFMLLVDAPPIEASNGDPHATEPIDLLVLADTSGSMWGAPRANQIAFIEGLISALGPEDTFDLATADVETRWAFGKPRGNDLEQREEALRFLEARDPLGWTNLEQAFEAVCERAGARTHVVYVGDGVPTAAAADPVGLAHELERLFKGRGTFHAVVPGPSSEMTVLRALAGLGGGSVRSIGGGTDPAQTAFALLAEMSAPVVKDLEISFAGLPVAAVYPETLPNLPAGGQQVLVGRFDPLSSSAGGDLSGSIRVTGSVAGEEVVFAADVTLASEDEGNSFIPRLWARHHLDHLLDQGASDETRERIIVLSEDYQIVTPYTSFLVLESDADRERFGVRKRFRMRDGEEFFTAGRESGHHELLRQQMLKAKTWRRRLREAVLASLEGMGRDLTELLRSGQQGLILDELSALGYVSTSSSFRGGGGADYFLGKGERGALRQDAENRELFGDDEVDLDAVDTLEGDELGEAEPESVEEELVVASERVAMKSMAGPASPAVGGKFNFNAPHRRLRAGSLNGFGLADVRSSSGYGYYRDPFEALFPAIGSVRAEDPEWTWSEEVQELLARVDRRAVLAASPLGWRFATESTWSDPRGREQTTSGQHLIGPDRWVTLATHVEGYAYAMDWVVDGQRGVLREGWRLGRVRPAEDGDLASWSAPFALYFGDQLRHYAAYEAQIVEREGTKARITFSLPADEKNAFTIEIDVERGLVLELVWTFEGERRRGQVFEGFQQVGGLWWPTRIRSWNEPAGNQTERSESITRIQVWSFGVEELARLAQAELVRRDDAILLSAEDGDVAEAKQAVKDGTAGLDERWLLLRYYGRTQRWDAAEPHLEAFAEIAKDKPGLTPIRLTWLQQGRRQEELRLDLLRVASDLARTRREAEYSLATELLQYSHGLNQGNEVLEVLAAIHPVYTRQTIVDAELAWDQRRLQALANLNRPEEYFVARREAAITWPYATQMQTAFAQLLAQRGEVDQAIDWLAAAEAENGPWQQYERAQFRQTVAQILWGGYRLEQWIETFESWDREDPTELGQNLYNQYLSGLIYLDREREAWERIETWLALSDPGEDGEREPFEQARMHAAIQHALGQGHMLYNYRFEDDRAALLATTARALSRQEEDASMAGWIFQHWSFRETDTGIALLTELYREVEAGVEDLSPRALQQRIGWVHFGNTNLDVDEEDWEKLFGRVFQRWLATEDEKQRLPLAQILQAYAAPELRIRYFRQVLAEADGDDERSAAAMQLGHELRQQPWSKEIERELVGLLETMALDEDAEEAALASNLDQRVLALYDLVDWIIRARTEAIVTALPDYESMTRRTLRSEQDKAKRTVRGDAASLMIELEAALAPRELGDWATIERLFLQVENGTELAAAWTRALELLHERVEALTAATETEDVPLRERILAERCIVTCTLLLLGTDQDALAERKTALRAELERLVESGSEFPDGRASIRELIIALDDGDELESVLAAWFSDGREFSKIRWGRDYAHVLAERGMLAEAVEVLEEIDRIDELTPQDFRALADWYTALDQAEQSREARIRSYEVIGEDQLANDLYQRSQTYQRQGEEVPPELDPQIPLRFVALMRKARQPQNRFWVLRNFYEATKDYRLLECLPAAVIGHSSQSIYPFLNQVAGLAELIDEEATVDRVRTNLALLRERAETDVDRRALALLEFQIVLRAARQSHGTERHAERSLYALEAAFRGQWKDGEIGLMATFLANQGRLQPEALAAEQLRQLRVLSSLAVDPDEKLAVAHALGRTLWGYADRDGAVQVLEGGLRERRAVTGRLPQSANDPLRDFGSWLVAMKSFRRAESTWLEELAAEHPQQQVLWLREQLFALYRDAVLMRGELSLGRGDVLYVAVVGAMEGDLAIRTNEYHAQQVVGTLCELWRRAHHDLKLTLVAEDATGFAFGELPAVLDLYQYRGGQNMVSSVTECLSAVRGSSTALEFLIVRAENEPSWLRLQNQDFWQQHSWRFGNLLTDVVAKGELKGALEGRALAIVLEELREDLRTRRSRSRTVYDARYGYFWSAKRTNFVRAALAFLEERRESPHAITYAAEYLFRGLSAYGEAIDALFDAYRRGILHLEGRDRLATYLQEMRRYQESIPIVVELIEDKPTEARYRVMLMLGYFHTGDSVALVQTFEAAEAWFRENDWWTEGVIATLAEGCLNTKLFIDCVRLYDDAIALKVRTAPKRGVGDGVLCTYYRYQSQAYSGLGRTDDAVDAAAGAIVSWGSHISQRHQELRNLMNVLDDAEDLEGFVTRLDIEVESTGLDNPIVRKALGQVYLQREDYARAVTQLELALAARSNDVETHQLLMSAYDGMKRPELATDALLEWARTEGHRLSLYVDLGRRLLGEQVDRSERAFTNLVELSPHESEGHQLLAEVREEQDRWGEAAASWRHVIRIRTQEPTGYMGLARALIRVERLEEAREIIDHLRTKSWPSRFGNVRHDTKVLLDELSSRG